MTKFYRYSLILILLFLACPDKEQRVYADEKGDFFYVPDEDNFLPLEEAILRQSWRDKYIRIDKLIEMEVIKIKPEMTILDIGTGPGYFAFKFAEKLKGTGNVFATDIRIDFINYITEEAHKRGLGNLYPVLINKEGVDEFYSKHKYDLIFLCNVYHCLDNRVDYFKKMKNFLTENGQLAIILYKNVPLLTLDDFIDFKGLIKKLSLEHDSPFYKGLQESTRKLIEESKGEPNGILKNAIVDDFNRMLLNPHFYKNFFEIVNVRKKLPLYPGERDMFNWLLMCLKEEGVFDKAQKDLNAKEIRAIKKLNQLFFVQNFRQYLYEGRIGFYLPRSDATRHTSEFLVRRELEKAGYTLENEYDLSVYFDLLIFMGNNDVETKINEDRRID